MTDYRSLDPKMIEDIVAVVMKSDNPERDLRRMLKSIKIRVENIGKT